jgi:hypothetical protein
MNTPSKRRCAVAVALLVLLQVGCDTVARVTPASAVPATEPAVLSRDFDFNV